jgi:hypothetical protein
MKKARNEEIIDRTSCAKKPHLAREIDGRTKKRFG